MQKEKFRKWALKRLNSLSWQQRYIRDKKINSKLYDMIRRAKAGSVMLYIPLGMEVNILPLIARLRQEGTELLVPFMEDKSFTLVKYRLPLYKKRFGIKEPKFSKQFRKKKIDIAIVPIVGVDTSFRRIGFGKGMYDRFFARENSNIKEIIFVQRVLCFSSDNITDKYDVRADSIVAID